MAARHLTRLIDPGHALTASVGAVIEAGGKSEKLALWVSQPIQPPSIGVSVATQSRRDGRIPELHIPVSARGLVGFDIGTIAHVS